MNLQSQTRNACLMATATQGTQSTWTGQHPWHTKGALLQHGLDARVAAVEALAVEVAGLAHGEELDEAEEGVGLGVRRVRPLRRVAPEHHVQRRHELVHALHVLQARVELREDEEQPLHLLQRTAARSARRRSERHLQVLSDATRLLVLLAARVGVAEEGHALVRALHVALDLLQALLILEVLLPAAALRVAERVVVLAQALRAAARRSLGGGVCVARM